MLDIVTSYHHMQFQRKLMIKRKKMAKNLILGLIPNSGRQFFFSKIWLFESLDILVGYHHEQYQEKLMIHYWENLVTDGRTDRQRDRQTEESDFTGRCPTNVERPIVLNLKIFMITFVTSVDFLYQLLYEEKGTPPIYISDCICKYISATFVLWPILNRIPKQNKRKQSKIKAFLGNSCEIVFYTNRGINVEKLH